MKLRLTCLFFVSLLSASAQTNLLPVVVPPPPATNKPYSMVWVWSYPGTNNQTFAFFLNSNNVSVEYHETTNTRYVITNLLGDPWKWSAEIYSMGNGTPAVWLPTNYVRALFSTNVQGPWIELPATTMAYPPATGFLRWTNFNNILTSTNGQ